MGEAAKPEFHRNLGSGKDVEDWREKKGQQGKETIFSGVCCTEMG